MSVNEPSAGASQGHAADHPADVSADKPADPSGGGRGATDVPAAGSPDGSVLRDCVLEVEAHVAASGWDQLGRLYALAPTSELIRNEPGLAAQLGLDEASAAGTFTPIEQEELPADQELEQLLAGIVWPAEVAGAAAVVERLVLPPSAETQMPDASERQAAYAAQHPDRSEVRLAVAVTRDGRAHCAIRMRAHDRDDQVLDGPALVPGLVQLLAATLED